MSFAYSDMDQLILQRWPDVMGLIDAHRGVQERIEEMLDIVGERIARWARPLGYETRVEARDAVFHAWRPAWSDQQRGKRLPWLWVESALQVSGRWRNLTFISGYT